MNLHSYFSRLIEQVENSEMSNQGKDENGFFKPTRAIVLRNLNLLRDLHDKPRARQMVQTAWKIVVKELPPEWLILTEDLRKELQNILTDQT